MKLYLTVFEKDSGRAMPNGFTAEVDKYGSAHGVNAESQGESHEGCEDCAEDRSAFARLALLTEFVMGMGYEVSFTTKPHEPHNDSPSEGYEEVS